MSPTRIQFIHVPRSCGGSTPRSEHIHAPHSPSRSRDIYRELAAAFVFLHHGASYTWEGGDHDWTGLFLW